MSPWLWNRGVALGLVLVAGLACGAARAEDVKMFREAPSADELLKALGGDEHPPAGGTRSIILNPQGRVAAPATPQAVAFPITFALGAAGIRDDAVPFLAAVGGALRQDPALRLVIEGHTDTTGDRGRNMELSRLRAFAVMNFLVTKYGIDPGRLQATGLGPDDPLPGRDPDDADNRRVQFRPMGAGP